jgi:hypothetical protein
MTEFNCDEHPHGQIWASSFVPHEIAAQGRVMVGSEMLAFDRRIAQIHIRTAHERRAIDRIRQPLAIDRLPVRLLQGLRNGKAVVRFAITPRTAEGPQGHRYRRGRGCGDR